MAGRHRAFVTGRRCPLTSPGDTARPSPLSARYRFPAGQPMTGKPDHGLAVRPAGVPWCWPARRHQGQRRTGNFRDTCRARRLPRSSGGGQASPDTGPMERSMRRGPRGGVSATFGEPAQCREQLRQTCATQPSSQPAALPRLKAGPHHRGQPSHRHRLSHIAGPHAAHLRRPGREQSMRRRQPERRTQSWRWQRAAT
jgi:hypothetical protein